MAKFIFEMPDELAAKVEAWRGDHRLKFTADAVRQLLERGLGDDPAPVAAPPAPKPPSFSHGRSKTVVVQAKRQAVTVSRGKLDTVTERVSFGPVDALTGKPLERRGPMQKAEKSKR